MSTPDSYYEWGKTEPLSAANFTKRFLDLANRLKPLEALEISWQAALQVVNSEVLARSEAVIASLRAQLVAITELDWLTATSGTSVAFVEGGTASLIIDPQSRALFAPGPFAIVGLISNPQAYAIVTTVAYDRDVTGQWDVGVVAVVGALGTKQSGWAIGAVAGSTLVQMAFLNEAKALQADIRAKAQAAAESAAQTGLDRTATGQDRTQTGQDRIATGNDRAATLLLRNQAVEAAGTVDTSKFLQLDGLRQLTGKLLFAASASGRAAFNVPAGTDPSAPVEGDTWNAGGTLKALLGGVTRVFAFLGFAQTWTARQTFAVPLNLAPGGTSAVPADGDLSTTSTALVVRLGGTDQPVALANDPALARAQRAARLFNSQNFV